MTISAEVLETEALSLPKEEKTRLIVHLLESLEQRSGSNSQQVEQAWVAEANNRYEAYIRGEEQAILSEDVFKDLKADDR
ncbi:putative addiction module component [Idiomarina loihiensis]|uniref:addiction module protein n=1 Tax=Idiomarina TaxID=135575 RepID=UPI000D70F921|nr:MULTISPECIES: addiction module protein [Idiomarina]PWW41435.1 putative addiction module component [Idiomarina loihiensis]TDP50493.1 putative addiction module component [Idiomarina loihiensis]TDS25229.1 putative addiction module component [Idiomarina sp. H2]